MGKNNRQRRAAKQRRRQRQQGRDHARRATQDAVGADREAPRTPPPPTAEDLVAAAVAAWGTDSSRFDALSGALVERGQLACAAAERLFGPALDRLWARGWTPADLVHATGRHLSPGHAGVARHQVVADTGRRERAGQAMHRRWRDQVDVIGSANRAPPPPDPAERVRLLVEVLALATHLIDVPETIPPPGPRSRGPDLHGAHLPAGMLTRVRALLSKAESTTFDAEAEALTTKAQELIARHAIDEATLRTVQDVGDPSTRRLYIDAPYLHAKANLYAEVARANRCRVVFSEAPAWVTAFGYDHDLDAVELLTSSLLTQATAGMLRHGSRRDASGRSRTRSFRKAFLFGFGQRIGERLRATTDGEVSTAAETTANLLPVLAAREDRLRRAAQKAFPEQVQRSASIGNATGWSSGRAAAEVADLDLPRQRLPSS